MEIIDRGGKKYRDSGKNSEKKRLWEKIEILKTKYRKKIVRNIQL